MKNHYYVIVFGGCYLDINAAHLPFGSEGVSVEKEIRGTEYECLPGGSGVNFLRALQRLKRRGLFIGMRGDDPVGVLVEQLCAKEGLAVHLIAAPGKRTNLGLNMIGSDGSHIIYSIGSANQALTERVLTPEITPYLDARTFLYMGTLYKLDGLAADFQTLIETAHTKGAQVVVDHGRITPGVSEERFEKVRQAVLTADYYLPSRVEFLETWRVGSIGDGLALLAQKAPHLVVVVKDGARGAHYFEAGRTVTIAAPVVSSAHNLTGAGDTFNAGFLDAIIAGEPPHAAIDAACVVAANHVALQPKNEQ